MSDIPLCNLDWEPEMPDFEDLTRDKAERPDMSEKPLWNPVSKLNKSGWDLAVEELGLERTSPVQEPDMSG
jgi:hypothetical protein